MVSQHASALHFFQDMNRRSVNFLCLDLQDIKQLRWNLELWFTNKLVENTFLGGRTNIIYAS